jgi:hypothetical protein
VTKPSRPVRLAAWLAALGLSVLSLMAAACGGKAAFEELPGGGGGGGPGACVDHNDCPVGTVCLYGASGEAGTCAPTCTGEPGSSCPAGLVCDACASASCPTCDDCIAACVPAKDGRCDDTNDCPGPNDVCLFATQSCALACKGDGPCPSGYVCSPCATSSCPGCRDCVDVCLPPPP